MVSEHASPLAVMGGDDAGGQNVHVAALARHLAGVGHDVTVWTRRDDPALPDRVVSDGVAVMHVDAGPPRPIAKDQLPRWMDDFAADLTAAWRYDPPDVIHSHFWMSGRAALHARPPATPVLHTFHALGVVKRRHLGVGDPSPGERLRVEQVIARSADRIIATCCDELRELHGMGTDPDRVDVVPCGVDLDHFRPDGPRDGRTGRSRIVVVSRLVARKGVDDVIRALAALPDAELVVAGGPPHDRLVSDPEVRRLLGIARQCGVADRVRLRGALSRTEVAALLRSADVVACTPWYEPFGIVPLEAMASGVPVVASAVGGMLDSVVDGVTGLHVPPRDPLALAAALGRLLGDGGLRARFGEAGRRHAVDHYAWSTVATGTLASYHAACNARPQGDVVGLAQR